MGISWSSIATADINMAYAIYICSKCNVFGNKSGETKNRFNIYSTMFNLFILIHIKVS